MIFFFCLILLLVTKRDVEGEPFSTYFFILNNHLSLTFSWTISSIHNLLPDCMKSSSFRLGAVMCMGVTAGAYILTLFAVGFNFWNSVIYFWSDFLISSLINIFILQMKYRERVLGLILISPLCKGPSWSEWFYNKVPS